MKPELIGKIGPKKGVKGKHAVCASQHPIVTDTVLQIMKEGGNAIDAAIAGCLVQATVQQDMTNHAGSVTLLYWEANAGRAYQLNCRGMLVPDLAPFCPVPPGAGLFAGPGVPIACIPGFMPGMKGMYERFATKPWDYLCQPAIQWAEQGHVVGSFEHLVLAQTVDFYLYTPSGREHFTPNGHLPQVGQRWKKPALATTLKRLAKEGPDYFITGEWAEHLVERANQLGWKIEMEHLTAVAPRWEEPLKFPHRGYEIVQLAPPQRQGIYCAIVLGILNELDVTSLGHYAESAEALYYMAHALRRAGWETGLLHDPETFEVPADVWQSRVFHKMLAELLKHSKPRVDLTKHVELTSAPAGLAAAGMTPKVQHKPDTYEGSCELSIVDSEGNWVQLMNTLQSGGIPGEVVDGVCMVGSHHVPSMLSGIASWYTGGGQMRSALGNTLVLKDGKPWLSLGTPGNVHCTIPQVLSNILDYNMDPYEAIDAPRMLPLEDDYKLGIESRIPESVVAGLAKMGILVKPLPRYDYHMGSFQMCWRDKETGLMNSTSDPRREGKADGF